MALRGKYKIKKPEKYLGNYHNVTYRSRWELKTFQFLEQQKNVKFWASEEIKIPYYDWKGGRHTYYPDLYFELVNGSKWLIEIKPASQTRPPKNSKSKRYFAEQRRWKTNEAKWTAAIDFCDRAGLNWRIWTEKDLNKTLGLKI